MWGFHALPRLSSPRVASRRRPSKYVRPAPAQCARERRLCDTQLPLRVLARPAAASAEAEPARKTMGDGCCLALQHVEEDSRGVSRPCVLKRMKPWTRGGGRPAPPVPRRATSLPTVLARPDSLKLSRFITQSRERVFLKRSLSNSLSLSLGISRRENPCSSNLSPDCIDSHFSGTACASPVSTHLELVGYPWLELLYFSYGIP